MIYQVISLFSGMGGMDLGFGGQVIVHEKSVVEDIIECKYEVEGFVKLVPLPFKIVLQNDILPIAKKITEWNNWSCSDYILSDIRELHLNLSMIDVIIGGIPCQTFSHSGKREGFSSDRGTLYQSFIKMIHQHNPLVFVVENVYGLLTMKGVIETIISDFSDCGYSVEYQLIKCEEHGIPQTRWRTIIIGVRQDKRHLLPNNWNVITENRVCCPVGNYLAHLLEPTDTTDPAQQVYSKASKLSKGQGQKELVLTQCAPTIRAEHHGNIEFRRLDMGVNKENHLPQRRLTLREVSLIQTFPPNCILTNPYGKKTSTAYKPIGNAVPPLLSYLIARKVKAILDVIK